VDRWQFAFRHERAESLMADDLAGVLQLVERSANGDGADLGELGELGGAGNRSPACNP